MISPSTHPTAIVSEKSQIGRGVQIGPYAVIEENVSIGDGTVILDHAHIGQGTTMGRNNFIHMGAVIGHQAQHKSTKVSDGFLTIGDNNMFREYATVHRGSLPDSSTVIGNDNYFMAFSHVGHDNRIGNHVTVTNAVLLGGHVTLEDDCMLGGASGVHQFCRIGRYAMIGGQASITRDVPPYMLVDNNENLIGSMNIIGLRRAEFSDEAARDIKNAYKLLYLSGLTIANALKAITENCRSAEVVHLINFIKSSKRGILQHRRRKNALNPAESY